MIETLWSSKSEIFVYLKIYRNIWNFDEISENIWKIDLGSIEKTLLALPHILRVSRMEGWVSFKVRGNGCLAEAVAAPQRPFLFHDEVARPRPCARLWAGHTAAVSRLVWLLFCPPSCLFRLADFLWEHFLRKSWTCAFCSQALFAQNPTSDRTHRQKSNSSSHLPSFYLSSWKMEFERHRIERSKVNICNEGQGASGLDAGGRCSGWSREEGVCMGEDAGRGLGRGQQCPGRMQRTLPAQAVVAVGDYCAGRIDPVILYIEDNGSQVSHCLIFVTGVTDMEREKN